MPGILWKDLLMDQMQPVHFIYTGKRWLDNKLVHTYIEVTIVEIDGTDKILPVLPQVTDWKIHYSGFAPFHLAM